MSIEIPVSIKEYINQLSSSEIEQDTLYKHAAVTYFIMKQFSTSTTNDEQIKEIVKDINALKESHASMIEDNLRVIQSAELVKKINVDKIEEFNAVTKAIIDEPKAELKLKELTLKEYFIEGAIDDSITLKSRDGTIRNLSQLVETVYRQGLGKDNVIKLPVNANDIEKRSYYSDAFEYIMNNVSKLSNAKVVYNTVNSQFTLNKKNY